MKKLINYTTVLLLQLLLVSNVIAQVGTGILQGSVMDATSGDPIPFSNVVVMQQGQQVTGASTDFDGKYKIPALKPGSDYIVRVSSVGYTSQERIGVIVKANQITFVDFKMVAGVKLDEVVVMEYEVPLIEKDGGSAMTVFGPGLNRVPGMGSTGIVTGRDIEKMPSRGAAEGVISSAGVQDNDASIGSVRGSRSGSTYTYIDGVKVRGNASLPQAAYEQTQVLTGGIPAQYGEANRGILKMEEAERKAEYVVHESAGLSIEEDLKEIQKRKGKKEDSEGFAVGYDLYKRQPFKTVYAEPLSAFSIDVDAASYSQVRRSLNMGSLPHPDIVRIEEIVNYFKYDYPQPEGDDPFSITTEVSKCPWNKSHQLVHIGLQGKELQMDVRPKNNLVFLIDVSGSMSDQDKLPLLQKSLRLLVNELKETDKISMVVYAGAAGVVLPSTSGDKKDRILDAIDRLSAGGSTAGGAGIELAYSIAERQFLKNGNNRVILCTDGDFNVGVSSAFGLEKLIEKKRESGVFLTVLGFGTGNFQDHKMETLADKGNGNFAYIDNLQEAQKVLVQEFWGTLFTIAKDVKIQIEFNPANVMAYRLIGYENRRLAAEDFNDDRKDAGELGAGHTVTALYEVIPVGGELPDMRPSVDSLKYQLTKPSLSTGLSDELLTVKLRYKQPDGDVSKLISQPLANRTVDLDSSSVNMRFSAALSLFGITLLDQSLKDSQRMSQLQEVIDLASASKGVDEDGRRAEFIRMAGLAMAMK